MTRVPDGCCIHFMPAVRSRNALAHAIVAYDDETWATVKGEAENAAATQWLARAVKCALLRDKPYVKKFYNALLETPDVVSCGRSLVLAIRNIPAFEVSAEQTSFKDDLDSRNYFVEGMSVVDLKLAASQIKKDHELLAKSGIVGNAPITLLNKPSTEMKPNVRDMLSSQEIDLVINVRDSHASQGSQTDGYLIRRTAVDFSVCLLTDVKLATLLIHGLHRRHVGVVPEVKAWDEFGADWRENHK